MGLVLHDISKHDEQFAISFIESPLKIISRESLVNVLLYFNKNQENEHLKKFKKP